MGDVVRRFVPDARVVALLERHGAARVGSLYGLDGDALRRYRDGASQRTTRWWIEVHIDAVERDLRGPAPRVLALVPSPGTRAT